MILLYFFLNIFIFCILYNNINKDIVMQPQIYSCVVFLHFYLGLADLIKNPPKLADSSSFFLLGSTNRFLHVLRTIGVWKIKEWKGEKGKSNSKNRTERGHIYLKRDWSLHRQTDRSADEINTRDVNPMCVLDCLAKVYLLPTAL